jgi:hypothetical protein
MGSDGIVNCGVGEGTTLLGKVYAAGCSDRCIVVPF